MNFQQRFFSSEFALYGYAYCGRPVSHLPAVRNPLNLHKLYIPKLFYITLYN